MRPTIPDWQLQPLLERATIADQTVLLFPLSTSHVTADDGTAIRAAAERTHDRCLAMLHDDTDFDTMLQATLHRDMGWTPAEVLAIFEGTLDADTRHDCY